MNYQILKIKLNQIIKCIEKYTSEPSISVLITEGKKALENDDEEICYDIEIQNNTGTDFEEITFVSTINDEQDYETITNFDDGDTATLTFTIDELLEKGTSISTSFDISDYDIDDGYSYSYSTYDYSESNEDDNNGEYEVNDLEDSNISTTNFTNKYGTPTTKCHHAGCEEYIASSGDTNCCAKHSNKCLECGKYIDEDATWCMDCIANAADVDLNEIEDGSSSSSLTDEDTKGSSRSYSGSGKFY